MNLKYLKMWKWSNFHFLHIWKRWRLAFLVVLQAQTSFHCGQLNCYPIRMLDLEQETFSDLIPETSCRTKEYWILECWNLIFNWFNIYLQKNLKMKWRLTLLEIYFFNKYMQPFYLKSILDSFFNKYWCKKLS